MKSDILFEKSDIKEDFFNMLTQDTSDQTLKYIYIKLFGNKKFQNSDFKKNKDSLIKAINEKILPDKEFYENVLDLKATKKKKKKLI